MGGLPTGAGECGAGAVYRRIDFGCAVVRVVARPRFEMVRHALQLNPKRVYEVGRFLEVAEPRRFTPQPFNECR
jgi:hypothetical protein